MHGAKTSSNGNNPTVILRLEPRVILRLDATVILRLDRRTQRPDGVPMALVNKLPKPVSTLFNYGRSYSMWVYQWGLACCALEMGATFASPRYDVMRLG